MSTHLHSGFVVLEGFVIGATILLIIIDGVPMLMQRLEHFAFGVRIFWLVIAFGVITAALATFLPR